MENKAVFFFMRLTYLEMHHTSKRQKTQHQHQLDNYLDPSESSGCTLPLLVYRSFLVPFFSTKNTPQDLRIPGNKNGLKSTTGGPFFSLQVELFITPING